jgi:hydrogenase expression/formation protein HypE
MKRSDMTANDHLLAPGKLPGPMLQRLISEYRTPSDDSVVVNASYGFDAAAIEVGGETIIVKSDPITFATTDAARYVVAVNANDIACMGGVPRWLTVVALLPEKATTPELVESLFSDLRDACVSEGIMLVGGHTEITFGLDRPILVGTLIGTARPEGMLRPGMARAGDELYVTKTIGIEGTAILAAELRDRLIGALGDEAVRSAASLIDDPGISVTLDAATALDSGVVTALHDPTEGGLATAVHEIAEASSLGAVLTAEEVPIRPVTRRMCDHLGIDPLGLLSSGALLIAARPDSGPTLKRHFERAGIPVTRIGVLTTKDTGCTIIEQGTPAPLPRFDSDELARALSS